jgi:hypothetical protein
MFEDARNHLSPVVRVDFRAEMFEIFPDRRLGDL